MSIEPVELSGKRIVVVEDDFHLARDLCRDLRAMGATVLGPAPTPFYAMQLIGQKDRNNIDAAVLDIRLHGATVFNVAETLQERGVPFIFATGEEKAQLPQRFQNVPVLRKPFRSTALAQELYALVGKPRIRTLDSPTLRSGVPHEAPAVHFARALASSMRSN